jgi:mRNA interferase MazF
VDDVDAIRRGEIWWVDLPEPRGSEPGFRRPVVVLQDDYFTASRLPTLIVVAITRNLALAELPGNVLLSRRETGLRHDSVANVSSLITVDKAFFVDPGFALGKLGSRSLTAIEEGVSLVLAL